MRRFQSLRSLCSCLCLSCESGESGVDLLFRLVEIAVVERAEFGIVRARPLTAAHPPRGLIPHSNLHGAEVVMGECDGLSHVSAPPASLHRLRPLRASGTNAA